MLKTTHRSPRHLKRLALALLAFATLAAPLTLTLASTAYAATTVATSYAWKDRQSVSVSGGDVKAGQAVTLANPDEATPTAASGKILMTEVVQVENCTLWVFCSTDDVVIDCFITLRLTFSSAGSKATIAAARADATIGTPGSEATQCSQEAHDQYNGKNISISGTRPGDGSSTVELEHQKYVYITVRTGLSSSEAPESVKVLISGAASRSEDVTREIDDGDVVYSTSFILEPGNYTARVDGIDVPEASFAKMKFQSLWVELGDAEGYGSRQIKVNVRVEAIGGMGASTAGPVPIYLYNANGTEVQSVQTNAVTIEETAMTDSRTYVLRADLNDVDPGDYRICVGAGEDHCQDVTKVAGEQKAVEFTITGQEALDLTRVGGTSSLSSCSISGVGWILCPVLTFGAELADSAYDFLADNFLEINAALINTNPDATDPVTGQKVGTGTYSAWVVMRNIANVAFVIVFLIIVFSQMTGAGVSSYGVKKMLPRLVIGAILVNVSFFICQLAVDLSNILGYGLKSLLEAVAEQVNAATGGAPASTDDQSNNLLAVITLIVSGAAAVGSAGVGAAIVAVVGAVITLLTIFLILVIRQVMVVLLVVLAPLAFVAYLLPNTESLFTKWRKMFVGMLTLFPVIGLIYGACLLASAIMLQVAGDSVVMKLVAYMALVIPLIAIIPVTKGALNAIPVLGSAIQNLGKKATGGAMSATKRRVDESALGTMQKIREQNKARRRSVRQGRIGEAISRIPGQRRLGQQMAAGGVATASKAEDEEIQNQMVLDRSRNLTSAQHLARLEDPRTGASARAASIRALGEIGGMGDVMRMARASALQHMSGRDRQDMAAVIAKKSGPEGDPAIGGASIAHVLQGTYDETARHVAFAESADFSARRLLTMHDAGRTALLNAVGTTEQGSAARQNLNRIRDQIRGNAELESLAGPDLLQLLDDVDRQDQVPGQGTLLDVGAGGELVIPRDDGPNGPPPAAGPQPPQTPPAPPAGGAPTPPPAAPIS